MANTLKFKRGLVSTIPTAALGEPLFTTDTFDLYIGNGTGNTRFQKYIASGATTQILRGDGSLYTFPLNISSPSNGQVLKYNGTSWVNDSDAGITGSGSAGQVAYFTGATTQGGSNNLFWDATNNRLGIGNSTPTWSLDIATTGATISRIRGGSSANQGASYFVTQGGSNTTLLAIGDGSTMVGGAVNNAMIYVNGSPLSFNMAGTTRMTLDSSGNLGLGVTPSAWGASHRAMQVTTYTSVVGIGVGSGNVGGMLTSNAVYADAMTSTYITSRFALTYYQNTANGNHQWYVAPSGTAGNAITFTQPMTLTANGRLLLGTTTEGAQRLQVVGTSYFSDSVGIGTTSLTGVILRLSKTLTGSTSPIGLYIDTQIQSDATNSPSIFGSTPSTQAASFTIPNLYHYSASMGTIGAGSAITNQYGFMAQAGLVGATNNYGFYGNIASGTGRWNLYMNGTADNYLAGSLGIGITSLGGVNLYISKNMTGFVDALNFYSRGAIQSDVTGHPKMIATLPSTAAASFTVANLSHVHINQGTFGAGSTVTNQYGVNVTSTLIGATNNYGIYSNIPSGTGRWNLYMNGTALNYFNGNVLLGSTTDSGEKLQVTGTMKVTGASTMNGISSASRYVVTAATSAGTTDISYGSFSGGVFINTPSANTGYLAANGNQAISWTPSDLIFYTSAIERARITSTGLSVTVASTFSSSVTAASFIPSSSTIPTNGMYLGAANQLNFATNSTSRLNISSTGTATFSGAVVASNITVDKLYLSGTTPQIVLNNQDYLEIFDANGTTGNVKIYPESGTMRIDQAIKTSAPTTGSAGSIKFGQRETGSYQLTGSCLRVNIDGTDYLLGIVTPL